MQLVVLVAVLCALGTTCLAVDLRQDDFTAGTVILTEPGSYRLVEDVIFNPNSVSQLGVDSYRAGGVQPSQFTFAGGKYDPAAFGIGFFAAISITGNGITLDLNGHSIRQSKEHALQQRFYANIELADQPFIPAQGPHNFGSTIGPAVNVVVKNGRLGRSSHHGIHGNGCVNVTISNMIIEDFEVAGIALNGVQGAIISDVTVRDSRTDVPVVGAFSAGRFIRRYVNFLAESGSTTTLMVNGRELTASDVQSDLADALNTAFDDIIEGNGFIDPEDHPEEYDLFHNDFGMIDGVAYGLLLNQLGVAVDGFPDSDVANPAERVLIKDVTVSNVGAAVVEVPGIAVDGGIAALDAVGALFQLRNISPRTNQPATISSLDEDQAVYTGNAVSNAQAFVAKAKLNGEFEDSNISVARLSIPAAAIQFVEGQIYLSDLTNEHPWVCNADIMFHVLKGVIGFKLDGSDQVTVSNVEVRDLVNKGSIGLDICNYTPTTFSNPLATVPGYEGAIIRGVSVAGSFDIDVDSLVVSGLTSFSGSAIGVDIFTDSHMVTCRDCVVEDLSAGEATGPSDYDNNPTELPQAIGFRVGSQVRDVNLDQFAVDDLTSSGTADAVQNFGQDVFLVEASDSGSSSSSGSGSGSGSGSSSSSASDSGSSPSSESSLLSATCCLVLVAGLLFFA